ncbi:hypothetical protein [Gemmatimonas sp.]|uniref:hypothetical protein n=1 Tax=Gemmatimonas sp. TaxID=1962908 RepID=UPI00356A2D73
MFDVLTDGGCAAYPWVPPTMDGAPPLYADEAPNGWYKQEYSTPELDDAPWYSPSYPESAQALGFWVTEWTGLDSGHIKREVTQVGAYRGGGQFGATNSAAREMGLEVILLGESEAALDYLFRWLDATISSVCATCATDSILLRRICPDVDPDALDTVANGVVEMREVGMVTGLVWGGAPVERAGCFIRRVNFTMAAMDPCMYTPCTDVDVSQAMTWATCFAGTNVQLGRTNCRPVCSEMPAACRLTYEFTIDSPGASAPRIHITAPLTASSIPMRIRTYANPNSLTPAQICGAPLLAELHLVTLEPFTEILYDMAGRQVQVRNAATGSFVNGFAFVAPNTVGVPRFAGLGCGEYMVVIEPDDFCFASPPSGLRQFSLVEVSTQERQGCA